MVASTKKKIVVLGDVFVDWIFARSRTSASITGPLFDPRRFMRAYRQIAGPSLLAEILERTIGSDRGDVIRFDPTEDDASSPSIARFSHTYFVASRFPHTQVKWEDNEDWVWRLEEEFGIQVSDDVIVPTPANIEEHLRTADVLITDDGHECSESSIVALLAYLNPQADVLIKLKRPSFTDDAKLLRQAVKRFGERLVIIVPVDDLRLTGMRINGDLSWERTVQDLMRELLDLDIRKRCKHFVVSLYNEGALVFSRRNDGNDGTRMMLYYDPRSIDRTWPDRIPGTMRGYTHCLTAGIGVEMIMKGSAAISRGIRGGLEAARSLHRDGLAESPQRMPNSEFPRKLAFPVERVSGILQEVVIARNFKPSGSTFKEHVLPFRKERSELKKEPEDWTILDDLCSDEDATLRRARRIIEWGIKDGEWDIPIARFDELLVVDRKEIESLEAVRSLIGGYVHSPERSAPLSIAIFGSPGTGKSFTIKAIAKSVADPEKHRDLTFNLSQFSAPNQIYDALHQVRDEALTGRVPLVFWDEFDSRYGDTDLGWLRYFLAPMQDGTFQEDVVTHNIGRSIFVFAGGTQTSMDLFRRTVQGDASAKGPDFLSRLHGHVDIPSVNHVTELLQPGVILRRALLLRTFIRRSAKHLCFFVEPPRRAGDIPAPSRDGDPARHTSWGRKRVNSSTSILKERINVDNGVINAFMKIRSFRYGARSMEAIVKMSSLKGKELFDRSSLPTDERLGMHVDAQGFLKLVEEPLEGVAWC